jgi:MerR family transcriptional regulator, thiopeptide resistance regulator
MKKLTVKQLADLSGVSVRTLHYYDKIGLLKPGVRAESRYRYYGDQEALRLQQILLYREIGLELSAIRDILDDPDFDVHEALESHRKSLKQQRIRLKTLIETVDRTLVALKEKRQQMNYRTLYQGFSKEEAEAYRLEAEQRWGKDIIELSHQRLLEMTSDELQALQAFGEELYQQLAGSVERSPEDPEVQQLISLHFQFVGKHFDVTREIYAKLGVMYAEDERFRAYYNNYDPKLADFLREAIRVFCR